MWPVTQRRGQAPAFAFPHRRYAREPQAELRTGLFDGEPETCRRDARRFLPVMAHLGLMLAVILRYRVEGRAFQTLVVLALAALPVHYLLPYRWKRPLFIALSMGAMAYIFGVTTAAAVLAAAAVLIAASRLPIAWGGRVALVAAIAGVCAWLRTGPADAWIPPNVWPVLAAMFMFRMMIYLYELKHARRPEPLSDALGYFFLLPNYCFLHFPVVDYRTFQRGYFSRDVHEAMRAGLQMMFKGTTHLLLYRLVYHELLTTPDEVRGPADLAVYLVCNYLLYLRVSGQFHMACGMLHLFGWTLPETHRHYLLAESFTDYWRRINIYWKDFMVRLAFNPVVFRLKRWPRPAALATATAVVFVVTWALHAYQSFWLRGEWGFSLPDALFWGVLGLLVLVNVQIDARRALGPKAKDASVAPADGLPIFRAARVAGTFTTIAVLWSLWSSPSVAAWAGMMARGLGLAG
jgi:hypothetical protein